MPERADREYVRRLLAEGGQLVEVLPAADFATIHIAGAINIPLKELGDRARELDPKRAVAVYCNDFQ